MLSVWQSAVITWWKHVVCVMEDRRPNFNFWIQWCSFLELMLIFLLLFPHIPDWRSLDLRSELFCSCWNVHMVVQCSAPDSCLTEPKEECFPGPCSCPEMSCLYFRRKKKHTIVAFIIIFKIFEISKMIWAVR